MKRYNILFLIIFTALIILPANIFAEEITEIEITGFNEPVIGRTPKFTATAAEDANYTVILEGWMGNQKYIESKYNPNIDNPLTTFEKDVTYLYSVYLKAKDGYTFADIVTAKIDDITLEEYRFANDTLIFEYEYGSAKDVDFKISNVTMPKAGETPTYTGKVPQDANYKIYEEVWHDSEGNIVTSEFENGKEYTYYCLIVPINNQQYNKPIYATVNDQNMEFESDEGNLFVFSYKYKIEQKKEDKKETIIKQETNQPNNEIENPNTGDSIASSIIIGTISLIGIILVSIKLTKRNKLRV